MAKVEAERRALRVVRLESELANAELMAANEAVVTQRKCLDAGEISQADLAPFLAALEQASGAAQAAEAKYRQAQLDAAALDLRRQKQLFAAGSARKADVTRAEEKLAELQHGEEKP